MPFLRRAIRRWLPAVGGSKSVLLVLVTYASVNEHSASVRTTLFERPFLTLTYDEQNRWLHAQWRGRLTLEAVREGSEEVLALVRAKRYQRLLNDNTRVTELGLSEEEQAGYQIMHLLFEAGLHYLAWIYAPVPQGRSYAENSVAVAGWPLILTFEEYGPAAEWLRQAP